MGNIIDLQIASTEKNLPSEEQFTAWVNAAIADRRTDIELTVRIVDAAESAELNLRYRNKPGPTNVLSFPADYEPQFNFPQLGDIIICAPVVSKEASANNIELLAHWAHITIHGTLHLLGFDHIEKSDAIKMEKLETQIVSQFGYPPPYGEIMDHA